MKFPHLIFLMLLALLSTSIAHAGAAAKIHGCIQLDVAPEKPLKVSLTPKSVQCMNKGGKKTSFEASQPGLTCGTVGVVESKHSSTKGDTCMTTTSKWSLSYEIEDSSKSGATKAELYFPWIGHAEISLKDRSPHTTVCNTKAVCPDASETWSKHKTPNMYIIFQPYKN